MAAKKSDKQPKPKATAFKPGGVWRGLKVKIQEGLGTRHREPEQEPRQRRGKG
jgi:hypothetical protein